MRPLARGAIAAGCSTTARRRTFGPPAPRSPAARAEPSRLGRRSRARGWDPHGAGVAAADFLFLRRATGLTTGNPASDRAKREDAGLVTIEKRFIRKKPNTSVTLMTTGRTRIARHWEQLEQLKPARGGRSREQVPA